MESRVANPILGKDEQEVAGGSRTQHNMCSSPRSIKKKKKELEVYNFLKLENISFAADWVSSACLAVPVGADSCLLTTH